MTPTKDDHEMAANLTYRVVAAVHADQHGHEHHPDAIEMAALTATALANERATERRRIVAELRNFADDLYDTTGARWIADALTSVLDRISEGDEP